MIRNLFELKPVIYGQYNDIEILKYMVRKKRLKYIIYGTGDMAVWFEDWMHRSYGIRPEFIIDKMPHKKQVNGIKVIGFDGFLSMEKEEYFIVVAEKSYEDKDYRRKLSAELLDRGAKIIFNASSVMHSFWPSWYVWIKEHTEELEETANLFADEISRNTLVNYLKVYIDGEPYRGQTFPEEYKYWGVDDNASKLFELTEDEVILNLGGYTGDTVFQYIANEFPFKKIISVEGAEGKCRYIRRSVNLLEASIRNRIQVDCMFLDENNRIDDIYNKEKISLIEMDIEGAEMDVLKGAEVLIKKRRPVLAICAYHKKDDLIKIPGYLLSVCKDYDFVLRKYPSEFFPNYQCIMQVNELVMYAIPKERSLI